MAISRTIVAQNIVLATNNLNTSMFGQYWFVNNKIFKPEEFLQDAIFVPGFTQVSSADCQMTIVPNQIQMAIKEDDQSKANECVKSRFTKMVEAIGTLPIIAIGLNYIWKIVDNERDNHQLTSFLFADNPTEIYSYFNKNDSMYGAYFSQNYDMETRLKLDIKPVHSIVNGQREDYVIASFNYHRDIRLGNTMSQLLDQLKKWNNLRQNSNKIVCLLK